MRRTFSYDGHGINGPDEYRTRLATFTEAGKAYPGLGKLLEAAPEMLEALELAYAQIIEMTRNGDSVAPLAIREEIRVTIARAKGTA